MKCVDCLSISAFKKVKEILEIFVWPVQLVWGEFVFTPTALFIALCWCHLVGYANETGRLFLHCFIQNLGDLLCDLYILYDFATLKVNWIQTFLYGQLKGDFMQGK